MRKKNKKKTAVFTSEKNNLTISHACGKRRREREERRRRTKRTFAAVFCHVWRSEDASAEKTDRGERFFVGFDREERRYLFQTYPSEIEFDGREILVRSEW